MERPLSELLKLWRAERPDEWTMDEFIREAERMEKQLQNKSSNSDYAKLAKYVHDCVSFGGTVDQVEDYLMKNFAYSQNVI